MAAAGPGPCVADARGWALRRVDGNRPVAAREAGPGAVRRGRRDGPRPRRPAAAHLPVLGRAGAVPRPAVRARRGSAGVSGVDPRQMTRTRVFHAATYAS